MPLVRESNDPLATASKHALQAAGHGLAHQIARSANAAGTPWDIPLSAVEKGELLPEVWARVPVKSDAAVIEDHN